MTDRDQIAAQIAGSMSGLALESDWIAKRSYEIADELLKAREDAAAGHRTQTVGTTTHGKQKSSSESSRKKGLAILEFLTTDWQDLTELREVSGLTYSQASYQVRKLGGSVEVKKEGKTKLYRLIEKPELDRQSFARHLGYSTMAQALEVLGSWEFEKQFNNYNS